MNEAVINTRLESTKMPEPASFDASPRSFSLTGKKKTQPITNPLMPARYNPASTRSKDAPSIFATYGLNGDLLRRASSKSKAETVMKPTLPSW